MTLRNVLRSLLTTSRVQPAADPPGLLAQFQALMATRPPTPSASGPRPVRIGIASFGAGANHLVVDCLLAHALQGHGAVCQLLLCDLPELPACDERFVGAENNHRCQGDCIAAKLPFLDVCGLDWVRLSGFLDNRSGATLKMSTDLVADCPDDELTSFEFEGWNLGEWLGASVASFLRSDSHGMDREIIDARRRYLTSGLVALIGSRRWIDTLQPDILMVISGRHIFWRAAREVAQARGIKVVSREMFIESFDCHIYAVNSSCEDPALPTAWARAREIPLTPEQERIVDENLRGLPAYARQVEYDPVLEARPAAICADLNLAPDRPMLVLFTNVSWDLFVAERDFAFDGQMKWIDATFDFIRRHPELDLVVRAHPAELVAKFQTRGRILQQIEERLGPIPPNVRLIGPESTISSDTLRSMASLNLVYCSSVGMEAVIAGQPVLICGNPYYARKGFTINVDSPVQYQCLLEDHAAGKPVIPPAESAERARRFLYLFKFRYGIRMGLTSDDNRATALKIQHLRELEPGRSFPIDTVCDGILHRDEILLPA
jgi:hypothetical protein